MSPLRGSVPMAAAGRDGDRLIRHGVAAIVAQHPDGAVAVVAENIRAVKLGDAVAAINHAADDRIADVIRVPL